MEDGDDFPAFAPPSEQGTRSKTYTWFRGRSFASSAQLFLDSGNSFEELADNVWKQLWDYDLISEEEAASHTRTGGYPEEYLIEDLNDLIDDLDEREYSFFYDARYNKVQNGFPTRATIQSRRIKDRIDLIHTRNGWPVQQFLQQREQGQQPRMYQPIDPITNEQHKSERVAALDTKDLVQLFNTNL